MSRHAVKLVLYLQCALTCPLADAFATVPLSSQSLQNMIIPNMGPSQFLLISSPSLGKVVYTKLHNFESTEGRSYALVSTGLQSPMGLAFDKKNGYLYVADQAQPAIYRYQVYVDNTGSEPSLTTSGLRTTIMQDHPVQWLTLDFDGNLFYTSPATNNINRIDADVLARVGNGEFSYTALQIVSQKTLEAEASAQTTTTTVLGSLTPLPTNAPVVLPQILQIYEAQSNPLVSSPSGLWADGLHLYWTNTKDGNTSGTIVKGETKPTLVSNPNGTDYFAAEAITKASSGAFNLAKVGSTIFFSQNGSTNGSGLVAALLTTTGDVLPVVQSLAGPRGLAWDGDQTLYVADEVGGNVWSFPSGRFMSNPPLQLAVAIQGAYGLAMLSQADPWYKKASVNFLRTNTDATNPNL